MPVPGNIGLQIHFVPPRLEHRKRIILVFVIPEPRAVGQPRKHQLPSRAIGFRGAVALLRFDDERVSGTRAKDVREVLIAFIFSKLCDLDGLAGPADELVRGLLLLLRRWT
jgi:hypothetical protein